MFFSKETCAICGNKHKAKEMFGLEPGSPLLAGVDDPNVKLCRICKGSYDIFIKGKYKTFTVENAYKYFKACEITSNGAQQTQLVRNFNDLMNNLLAGYPDYQAFQDAMKALYTEESGSMVNGYFAINEEKRVFSIMNNDHFSVPYSADKLAGVYLAEDGDDDYVKTCDMLFKFSDSAKDDYVVSMINTAGISRQSTIYMETLDTFNQVSELVAKLIG